MLYLAFPYFDQLLLVRQIRALLPVFNLLALGRCITLLFGTS